LLSAPFFPSCERSKVCAIVRVWKGMGIEDSRLSHS
jgi:hypothetical protein